MVINGAEEFRIDNSPSSENYISNVNLYDNIFDKETQNMVSRKSNPLAAIHLMPHIHKTTTTATIDTHSPDITLEIEPNGIPVVERDESLSATSHLTWVYEAIDHPSVMWCICSQIMVLVVGLVAKLVMAFFNKTRVHNRQRLLDSIAKRDLDVPLLTISNHRSGFDDPGLWGAILPLRYVCDTDKMRWSMAAAEVCFSNKMHALGFMYAKCIPVVRGIGVHQEAVDVCIRKCKLGHWVHMFPEGQVFADKPMLPLKPGVGRIIAESPRTPIILPIWHEGINEIMPIEKPGSFRVFQKITVNIGEPLEMESLLQDLKNNNVPEHESRTIITNKIQDALQKLRLETQALHTSNWSV